MSAKDRSGRALFYAIVAVILLAAGFLAYSVLYLEQRRQDLAELALQRTQQLLQIRLDGLFFELSEDLREEAAAVAVDDSSMVFNRWFPLLNTHWPIMAIRLADELGNEVALEREDSTYVLMHTAGGSKEGPPIKLRYTQAGAEGWTQGPWLDTTDNDPRERVWFSKALEDSRNEPIWTLRAAATDGSPVLRVSYLIRGSEQEKIYRIIAFTVDLSRSDWMDSRSSSLLKAGILVMDDEGRSLGQLIEPIGPGLKEATAKALEIWGERKISSSFDVSMEGRSFKCKVGSFALNGQKLNTGVVVDMAQLNDWLRPEWRWLMVMAVLLGLLIILLLWAWNKKQRSNARIRRQTKRNRSQELKLAKALGEREVLNREVHHRVKNNLQVVSSLLNLQATRLEEGAVKDEFLRGKRRIDTIALVHHKLYGLADLRNVDLNLFFTDLVKALGEMYSPRSNTISTEIGTADIKADQDTAIELGIILCELVSNTYQHAFPYATGGHVEIKVTGVEGDLYRLTVKDNGKGIPEGGQQRPGKLGLEIVEALAEQLDGSFYMRSTDGVLFEVLFRMQRQVGPSLTNDHEPNDEP